MKKIDNYINGKKLSISKNILDVFDPSIGEKISEVVKSNSSDFDEAKQARLLIGKFLSSRIWIISLPTFPVAPTIIALFFTII